MSGWRPALRMARRTARRNLRRSLLIAVLVALPVAGATMAGVLARTLSSPERDAWTSLGVADAMVTVTESRRLRDFLPSPDAAPGTQGRPERDPEAVDVAALLPAGTRLVRRRFPGEVVLRHDGDVLRSGLVIADPRDPLQRPFVTVRSGRAPRTAGEVLVSEELAQRFGVGAGDRLTDPQGAAFAVTGTARSATCHSCTHVFVPEDSPLAAPSPEEEGQPVSYLADLPAGTDPDALWPALARSGVALVPREAYLDPGRYGEATASPDIGADEVRGAALMALIVGLGLLEVVLLAGTAFAVGARRQTRELGLVAATGGTATHVRRIVIAQGVVLGLAGAALGVAAGLGLAALGRPAWERVLDADLGPLVLRPWELALAASVGVVSGLLAALAPAIGASRMRPVDALAGRFRPARRARATRPAIAIALLVAGLAASLTGRGLLTGDLRAYETALARVPETGAYVAAPSATAPVGLILLGVVALVGAVVLTVPAVIGRMAGLGAGLPVALRLAVRDGARHRHRTGPATTAVAVAVAGAVALAFLVAGTERAEELRHVPPLPQGMLAVVAPGPPGGGAADAASLRDGAAAARAELPGAAALEVRAVSDPRGGEAYAVHPVPCLDCMGGGPAAVAGDPELEDLLAGGRLPDEARAALQAGTAVVFDPKLLDGRGRMTLQRGGARPGGVRLPAVAVRRRAYGAFPIALLPASVVRDRGWRTRVSSVLVAGRPGTTAQDVERAIVAAERRGTIAFADEGTGSVADVLLAALAIVAAIVTLAGVAISVSLAAAEGRADLATLAAVGAAPRRRRALVAAQALLVGGLGAVLGLFSGTYVALVAQPLTGAPDLVVPWANLALTGLAVPLVAVAVAAAFTPSRLPLVRRVA